MSTSLYDSHTHIYEEEFQEDLDEVHGRALAKGVEMMLMPATDAESIRRTIEVNRLFPETTRMAFGLHPESVGKDYSERLQEVSQLLLQYRDEPSLVAIGEIGLDFYWDATYKAEQILALREQMEWAIDMDLPVILHTRSAHREMVALIAEYELRGLRGVFHSFTGTAEELSELLQFRHFMIGINGIFTFKKSEELRRAVAMIPMDRLLLETDAPYLAPVPRRGKRNEPSYVRYTAEALAQYLNVPLAEIAECTFQNAQRLFQKC